MKKNKNSLWTGEKKVASFPRISEVLDDNGRRKVAEDVVCCFFSIPSTRSFFCNPAFRIAS